MPCFPNPAPPAPERSLTAVRYVTPSAARPTDQLTCSALPNERSSARLTCRIDRLQD
ncbi:MAG: hypothetical protein RL654_973 [Pseudomonadota bacterium]|jgi:hypothetical protein